MHQAAGYAKANSPTAAAEVKAVWSGIRRAHGVAPQKVRAARTKVINAVVAQLGSKPIDLRDRALLLIGFAGALRRSELVALDVADITEDDQGLRLVLARSKTVQEGETKTLGLPYGSNPASCPGAGLAGLAPAGRGRHRPRFPARHPPRPHRRHQTERSWRG